MSNPTDPQTVPPVHTLPAQEVEEAVQTARRFARAKTLVKKTFTTVGVPVLVGTAAALVVSRKRNGEDSDVSESNDDTATNE